MTNVSFDVYKHIIELVMLDYSVDEISNCLNLEKSYIISMLKKIRSDIVSSMDEDSFYLIPMIDKSLGKKVKNVTRNFGGFKRNLIFGLLCDGKSYFEIINELNVSPSSYLSLLRTMYIDLYTYGSIEEKIYLPLVRNAIDEVLYLLKSDSIIKKEHIDNIPRREFLVQKGLNNEEVLSHSYVCDTFSLESDDKLDFIVIVILI